MLNENRLGKAQRIVNIKLKWTMENLQRENSVSREKIPYAEPTDFIIKVKFRQLQSELHGISGDTNGVP